MTDLSKAQTVKIQHYGTTPAKNFNNKRIFLQSLRRVKPSTKSSNKPIEKGSTSRRQSSKNMSFPREIIRSVYQFSQTLNGCTIDSSVFKLNTNVTVILLITFSLAVTTRQYVGHAIDCIHARGIPEDVLNTYCWIHSTFTVSYDTNKKNDLNNVLNVIGIQTTDRRPMKQIKYYQWVEFFLFIQMRLSNDGDLYYELKCCSDDCDNIYIFRNSKTRML